MRSDQKYYIADVGTNANQTRVTFFLPSIPGANSNGDPRRQTPFGRTGTAYKTGARHLTGKHIHDRTEMDKISTSLAFLLLLLYPLGAVCGPVPRFEGEEEGGQGSNGLQGGLTPAERMAAHGIAVSRGRTMRER